MTYRDMQRTMKIGMMGPNYSLPSDVNPDNFSEYLIRRSSQMGCRTLHYAYLFDDDDENKIAYLRDLSQQYDVELELRVAPEVWTLSEDPKAGLEAMKKRALSLHKLNATIMRGGYGRLTLETSRYAPDYREQMNRMEQNLKLARGVLEDEGVYLAVENHCDFKAGELAAILDAVDSPHVGCAFDSANGYTVYNDPDDEVDVIAPFTITTHLKDMGMIREKDWRIPFTACGTAIGDGAIDIPKQIEVLTRKVRNPIGFHMVIEISWVKYPEDADKGEINRGLMEKSIDYLKHYLYER